MTSLVERIGRSALSPSWVEQGRRLLAAPAADLVAYRLQHRALLRVFLALHRQIGVLKGRSPLEADLASRQALVRRYEALLERDLAAARAGEYPRELLFDFPWLGYLRTLPGMVLNAAEVARRKASRDFLDLPQGEDLSGYPDYYRQTFHWQSDGYLSRRSAELYDLAVEMLFCGSADVMRRQVLPPIARFLGPGPARLADLGCGTGRTLAALARSFPALELTGVDLSPYYLDVARAGLGPGFKGALFRGPAESLPHKDGYFDVVTSTWLFHELPRQTRDGVLQEIRRALRPGGLLVLMDSVQLAGGEDLAFFMERFAADFHEPYYLDYVADDLAARVAGAGFEVEAAETHFISRLVVARRPG